MSNSGKSFFGKQISIGKIEVDADSKRATSPEVVRRMQRILENYDQLDDVLADLEKKIGDDPTLKEYNLALEAENADTDPQPVNKPRKRRRKSAGPNKPR